MGDSVNELADSLAEVNTNDSPFADVMHKSLREQLNAFVREVGSTSVELNFIDFHSGPGYYYMKDEEGHLVKKSGSPIIALEVTLDFLRAKKRGRSENLLLNVVNLYFGEADPENYKILLQSLCEKIATYQYSFEKREVPGSWGTMKCRMSVITDEFTLLIDVCNSFPSEVHMLPDVTVHSYYPAFIFFHPPEAKPLSIFPIKAISETFFPVALLISYQVFELQGRQSKVFRVPLRNFKSLKDFRVSKALINSLFDDDCKNFLCESGVSNFQSGQEVVMSYSQYLTDSFDTNLITNFLIRSVHNKGLQFMAFVCERYEDLRNSKEAMFRVAKERKQFEFSSFIMSRPESIVFGRKEDNQTAASLIYEYALNRGESTCLQVGMYTDEDGNINDSIESFVVSGTPFVFRKKQLRLLFWQKSIKCVYLLGQYPFDFPSDTFPNDALVCFAQLLENHEDPSMFIQLCYKCLPAIWTGYPQCPFTVPEYRPFAEINKLYEHSYFMNENGLNKLLNSLKYNEELTCMDEHQLTKAFKHVDHQKCFIKFNLYSSNYLNSQNVPTFVSPTAHTRPNQQYFSNCYSV